MSPAFSAEANRYDFVVRLSVRLLFLTFGIAVVNVHL